MYVELNSISRTIKWNQISFSFTITMETLIATFRMIIKVINE